MWCGLISIIAYGFGVDVTIIHAQHGIIIFVANRASWTRNLIKDRDENAFTPLIDGEPKPYGITLMSNRWTRTMSA